LKIIALNIKNHRVCEIEYGACVGYRRIADSEACFIN
jgi:hypothetical protein